MAEKRQNWQDRVVLTEWPESARRKVYQVDSALWHEDTISPVTDAYWDELDRRLQAEPDIAYLYEAEWQKKMAWQRENKWYAQQAAQQQFLEQQEEHIEIHPVMKCTSDSNGSSVRTDCE